MTASETRAIRKARKSVVRAEREKRVQEFRERKRRRQIARQGIQARVSTEPTYISLRGYNPMMWCGKGQHPVRANFMYTDSVCLACRAGHKKEG